MNRLAIDGGVPVRDTAQRPWPRWPVFDEAEERALLEVLRGGHWWYVGGTQGPAFEREFAAFHDARYAVACTNGSAALEICLRALGIGPGDEVIVPPYTFIATASAALAVGATPIFVDIEPDTLNLDPARIEEGVTGRTRAVIPVHIAGRPADMDSVLAVARKHDLAVIEDAAQAHAAEWRGRKVGAIGSMGTFSFQASKNLNAGEGGIILTDDAGLCDACWSVTHVGRTRTGAWYEHVALGSNYRLTEFQSAILRTQLKRLPEQAARRSANAERLTALLKAMDGIRLMRADDRITRHAYHIYPFRIDMARFGSHSRAEFLKALSAEGVPCAGGYGPLYREALFHGRGEADYRRYAEACPVCEEVCTDTVWLGQHMLLGAPEDMADIAEAIRKIQTAWTG